MAKHFGLWRQTVTCNRSDIPTSDLEKINAELLAKAARLDQLSPAFRQACSGLATAAAARPSHLDVRLHFVSRIIDDRAD